MGRKDWEYITIPAEMAKALDEIVEKNGRRYGIYDKVQLVRQLTGDFIVRYDQENSIPEAKKFVEDKHSWAPSGNMEEKDKVRKDRNSLMMLV